MLSFLIGALSVSEFLCVMLKLATSILISCTAVAVFAKPVTDKVGLLFDALAANVGTALNFPF